MESATDDARNRAPPSPTGQMERAGEVEAILSASMAITRLPLSLKPITISSPEKSEMATRGGVTSPVAPTGAGSSAAAAPRRETESDEGPSCRRVSEQRASPLSATPWAWTCRVAWVECGAESDDIGGCTHLAAACMSPRTAPYSPAPPKRARSGSTRVELLGSPSRRQRTSERPLAGEKDTTATAHVQGFQRLSGGTHLHECRQGEGSVRAEVFAVAPSVFLGRMGARGTRGASGRGPRSRADHPRGRSQPSPRRIARTAYRFGLATSA
eukprot:scaffold259889_cov24-Tisochrysis_lutea.AAC.5